MNCLVSRKCVWILFADVWVSCLLLFVAKGWMIYFFIVLYKVFELWVGALSRLLPCIFWIFVSFVCELFFYLSPKVVVLWMNVFQNELCIRVHLKARREWSGTCLTIRNMPIIRGQILGCAWPVRSWWSPAASALPELSHCTRRYHVLSHKQISWWNVQDCQISVLFALLLQGQWEPRICSV